MIFFVELSLLRYKNVMNIVHLHLSRTVDNFCDICVFISYLVSLVNFGGKYASECVSGKVSQNRSIIYLLNSSDFLTVAHNVRENTLMSGPK